MRHGLALAALALVLAPAAAAKSAHRFFGGVVPDVRTGSHAAPRPRARTAGLPYGGGPVLHWNRTHAIFWEPSGSGLSFDAGYESLIGAFLGDVAVDSRRPTNVYGLSGQYNDSIGPATYNSSYGGSVVATDPLPPNGCTEPPALSFPLTGGPGWTRCLDDAQLVSELQTVIRNQRLPNTNDDVYFLILPNGLGSCEFGGPTNCALGGTTTGSYCGYHSATSDGLLYAVIPYNAISGHCQSGNPRPNGNAADPAISTISHEHNETVTDPLGDGWVDPSLGAEDGDLCISNFGPSLGGAGSGEYNEIIHSHHYWLQEEWSNEDASCQAHDESDRISFATPRHVRSRRPASFTGHASDPDGAISYWNWFFGDHGTSRSRRATHTYKRPGTYRVVLRTTDSAGNWAFFAAMVKVGDRQGTESRRHARPHSR